MSFQGDVAGLGLGELLQGLARGGREGVLTLRGVRMCARLGVLDGQILLLPEEDEDPELWRRRCQRAWADAPDERVDALRMRDIAYAARLEGMFRLLDAQNVHFRFEPGPVPDPIVAPSARVESESEAPVARQETGTAIEVQVHVTCTPISVEFILLEHARLSDEVAAHPEAALLSEHFVPLRLCDEAPHKSFERVWAHCDGTSTVAEICDRLGAPIRQVRSTLVDLFQRGSLRFADSSEQMALVQRELQAGRLPRAASRLAGWCRISPPGTIGTDDAQLLLAEWQRGKLPAALASIDARDGRTLLGRIDLFDNSPSNAIVRWRELKKHHRHDALTELRGLHWQLRSQVDADFPTMSELLRVARKFQDLGHPWRAGIVLRAAAARGPDTPAVRLEIGQRLCAVELVDEGAPWIIGVARDLIENGAPDRAMAPLRQLLAVAPAHREAKSLLNLAHGKTTSGKRTRRNSIAALATVLTLSVVAVIKVRVDQDYEARLAAVNERANEPEAALLVLEENFGDSTDDEVVALRASLEERIAARQAADRAAWVAQFQACQLECTSGDPVLGLRSALAMPAPPRITRGAGEPLPKLADLLAALAARCEETVAGWSDPSVDSPEAAHAEQRFAALLQELERVVASATSFKELSEFDAKIDSLALTLGARAELRAAAREKRLRAESIERQDALLAAARAHASAGDLQRAVETYDAIAQVAGSEKLLGLLAHEISEVRAHLRAWLEARELASAGRHADALTRLALDCPRPAEHLLPCRVDSLPQGARVRFADGSSRTTPFVLEVAPGERVSFDVMLEGFEALSTSLTKPADQMFLLARAPLAHWRNEAKVEALPVSVDADHVVCDRQGNVARLAADGRVVWKHSLASLGGVARTPVFLPKRPGALLVITEEGSTWIVDALDGRVEGPWSAGAPAICGPEPTSSGVRARLSDGREVLWTTRVRPESDERLGPDAPACRSAAHDAGLAALRRGESVDAHLASPWAAIDVEIEEQHFVVRRRASREVLFAARREGDWNYVAWEAPSARSTRGKLWISDGLGLRAFEL